MSYIVRTKFNGFSPDGLRNLCKGGGGGSAAPPANTTQVQTKEIPTWAQPSAINLLNRGESLSNTPFEAYGGQKVADMTGQQTTALGQIQNTAQNGSAEQNSARTNYTDTMNGKYLDPASNPYLQKNVEAINNDTINGMQKFSRDNGAFGNTGVQEATAKALAQNANTVYGQNYANERNNQIKDSSLQSQYGNIDYNNSQQLMGVGDIYRNESQQNLNNSFSDWQQQQNQPYRQLDVLANSLGASVNGQGNVQSAGYQANPYQANRYAGAIGGGLAGYSLGNMVAPDSYGGAMGGIAGGLLGGFG